MKVMDQNMKEILQQEELKYSSKQTPPQSSSPGLKSFSPSAQFHSHVYDEQPDSRHRKKIFDPAYKQLQHIKHLQRVQMERGHFQQPSLSGPVLASKLITDSMPLVPPALLHTFGQISETKPMTPAIPIGPMPPISTSTRRIANVFEAARINQENQKNLANTMHLVSQDAHMQSSMNEAAISLAKQGKVMTALNNDIAMKTSMTKAAIDLAQTGKLMTTVADDAAVRSSLHKTAIDLATAGKIISSVGSDLRNAANNPQSGISAQQNTKNLTDTAKSEITRIAMLNAVASDIRSQAVLPIKSIVQKDVNERAVLPQVMNEKDTRQSLNTAVARVFQYSNKNKQIGNDYIPPTQKILANNIPLDIHNTVGQPMNSKNDQGIRRDITKESSQLVKKVLELQQQINRLNDQIQQSQIRDTLRQQKLQSVLMAKQKEITRKKKLLKENQNRLYELRQIKEEKDSHILNLQIELEHLRRINDIARINEQMLNEEIWDQEINRLRASTHTQPSFTCKWNTNNLKTIRKPTYARHADPFDCPDSKYYQHSSSRSISPRYSKSRSRSPRNYRTNIRSIHQKPSAYFTHHPMTATVVPAKVKQPVPLLYHKRVPTLTLQTPKKIPLPIQSHTAFNSATGRHSQTIYAPHVPFSAEKRFVRENDKAVNEVSFSQQNPSISVRNNQR